MSQLTSTISLKEKSFQQKDEAKKIIKRSTLYAAGLGFIPIPLLDAVSITGIQIWMIRDIAKVYSVPFKRHVAKSFIGSLVGNVGAMSIVKFVPGVGSLLGGTTVSVGAATATYALGQVFMEHFSQGGTLLDFDPIKSRAYFQKLYQEHESTVQDFQKEDTEQVAFNQDNIAALAALKEIEAELIAKQQDLLAQQGRDAAAIEALQKENALLSAKEEEYLATIQENSQFISSLETRKEQLEKLLEEQEARIGQENYHLKNQEETQQQLSELIASNKFLKATIATFQKELKGKEEVEQRAAAYFAKLQPLERQLPQLENKVKQQVLQITALQQQLHDAKNSKINPLWWLLLPLLLLLGALFGYSFGNRTTKVAAPLPQESSQQLGVITDKEEIKQAAVAITPSEVPVSTETNILPSEGRPSLGRDALALGFDPRSAEGEMANYLSNPASVYPKTFWARKIYFPPSSNQPHASGQEQIENVALLAEHYPQMRMRVYGHTDQVEGKDAGINRAKVIAIILKEKGVAANHMLAYLIEKQQAPDSTRGVEFELLKR